MHEDAELCLRAVRSKDTRFDGVFLVAVGTTGIYCRPSCPAIVVNPSHLAFYPSAAAAQLAGYRACRRCRPDASPGSPQWNTRADVVARAMRLISDGVVDREGVIGLADRLGYSARQLERQLGAELGAGPLALARAQRAQTARLLVETSTMRFGDIAFAAGFGSIRTFNDTVRQVFGLSPTALRRRASGKNASRAADVLSVRLPYRTPIDDLSLFDELRATVLPGLEEWSPEAYRLAMRLPHGHAIATLRPLAGHIGCQLALSDLRDLTIAISRCRRLLDLDADPVAVDSALSHDPALVALVALQPGRRVARTVDPSELAMRLLLGGHHGPAPRQALLASIVADHGAPITDADGGLTHLFPEAGVLAGLDPIAPGPAGLGLPLELGQSFVALATRLASGDVDLGPGCDWGEARAQLRAIPGLDPALVEQIARRALGDPDAFDDDDDVNAGVRALGLPSAQALAEHSRRWRPWRAYAAEHLRSVGRDQRSSAQRRPGQSTAARELVGELPAERPFRHGKRSIATNRRSSSSRP